MAIDRTHDSLEGDDLSGQLALSSCVASAPVYELSDPEFQTNNAMTQTCFRGLSLFSCAIAITTTVKGLSSILQHSM